MRVASSAYLSERRKPPGLPDAASIDKLYGLEPLIEPGGAGGSDLLEAFVALECPYCAETYGVAVDLSGGSQVYIEDCQVCCQPISLTLSIDEQGRFESLTTDRMDR